LPCSRRRFLGFAAAGIASYGRIAQASSSESLIQPIPPALLARARGALEHHQNSIAHRDFMGIADFSLPSRQPRFHVVDLKDGSVRSHRVAHGRGSDPLHTGWLKRFSNAPGSNATSSGAYRTDLPYVGAHGHSIRLEGLDPSNDNALARGIVIHSAWYVSDEVVEHFGMPGRSEGCFALSASSLPDVMATLGPGRLVYADSIQGAG
jgi:hypothetical protein